MWEPAIENDDDDHGRCYAASRRAVLAVTGFTCWEHVEEISSSQGTEMGLEHG